MDLFVINRYQDTHEENVAERETANLLRLKQKIEERKRTQISLKEPEPIEITLKHNGDYSGLVNEDFASAVNKLEKEENEYIEESAAKKTREKPAAEFKVLGNSDFQKKITVKRILPNWLSNSTRVATNLQDLKIKVEELPWLQDTLKSTLLSEGVTHLFPVQEEVIPFILKEHQLPFPFRPHDICVSAPTGSGKTLSFVLPIVQILTTGVGNHIKALIVLPVQELATQVAKVFKKYTARTSLKVALLSGSIPLRQEQKQIVRYTETLGWISEVDIIICTAGRLVEHLQNTEGISLKHLKFLVIDEADRIMDHIQNDWLYHLDRYIKLENESMTGKVYSSSWHSLAYHNKPPHKLLFSATLSQDPEKLEQWSLFQPKLFSSAPPNQEEYDQIKKYTTPDELKEQFVICNAEEKPLILYHMLVERKWNRVLCFTNAAQSAHRLSVLLNSWGDGKVKVAELSAALDRTTREAVLKKFQQSDIDVLIGTDALARGIDVPECDYVVSYDPPRNIKTYIHRVGRTGRAGRAGCAVTILLQNQVNMFKETLRMGSQSNLPQIDIPDDIIERLSDSYESAINATKKLINEEITLKVKKSVALKRGLKKKPKKRKPFSEAKVII